MARPPSSWKADAAGAGVPARQQTSRAPALELALLALLGLVLAGGTLWWNRREQPAPEVAAQALAPRAKMRGAQPPAQPPRQTRTEGPEIEPPVNADDAPPAPSNEPPLSEDRALGQPQVPSAAAPHVRAPDPPPPSPLDPDEIAPDDPHDFELPARAAQRP